jgi:hypothetical protein
MQERFSWSKVAAQFEAICLRTLECRRGQRPGRDVAAS